MPRLSFFLQLSSLLDDVVVPLLDRELTQDEFEDLITRPPLLWEHNFSYFSTQPLDFLYNVAPATADFDDLLS